MWRRFPYLQMVNERWNVSDRIAQEIDLPFRCTAFAGSHETDWLNEKFSTFSKIAGILHIWFQWEYSEIFLSHGHSFVGNTENSWTQKVYPYPNERWFEQSQTFRIIECVVQCIWDVSLEIE